MSPLLPWEILGRHYAVIKENEIIVGETKVPLPPLDGTTPISFILLTNVDTINLKLSSETSISITKDNLDNDMLIKEDTLSGTDRMVWARFMTQEIREAVKVKFVFHM